MDINKFFSFTVKKLNKFSPTALHERNDISHRYYSHYTAQIYIYIYNRFKRSSDRPEAGGQQLYSS